MKNTTIGVDPSVSSILPTNKCPHCAGKGKNTYKVPSPTNIAEDVEKDEICDFCGGTGLVHHNYGANLHDHSTFILDNTSLGVDRIPDTVASHLSEPGRHVVMNDAVVVAKPSVDQVVNSVVIPTLRKLLAKMLSTTDASVPNKDQNRAIKKIIREAFDDVYFEVLRGAFPDVSFGQSVGSYAIDPEPDKKSKIAL